MEQILIALSPFVVSVITKYTKKVQTKVQIGKDKKSLSRIGVRTLVAFLSLGAAILTAMLSGKSVDIISVQTFVQTLLTFLGATGLYFFAKK